MIKHTYTATTHTAKDGRTMREILKVMRICVIRICQLGEWAQVTFEATDEQARSVREAFSAFRNMEILTEG
jgi:hypothetical protein